MRSKVDVLVVGLGPVGAAMAALLSRRGVSVVAVDKTAAVYPLPRAVSFDHEVMRVFQEIGIAEAASKHTRFSPRYEFLDSSGRVLMSYDRAAIPRPSGWPPTVTFYQPAIEELLRDAIRRWTGTRIMLSRELVSLTEAADGVTATFSGPDGPEDVRARFVVGADGASSTVRALCGITLHDYGFDEPWLVVDLLTDDEDCLPTANTQICDPSRPSTFVRMGPGRHRWEFMLANDETPAQMLVDATIYRLLSERGDVSRRIERKAVYRFHGLVAERWRKGRVFLIGDAAHQMPPFAGQGMCAGIRDAANLAWKLAAVLDQSANEHLLSTYQEERDPHVRRIIEAAIALGRIVCTRDPSLAAARDARMISERALGKPPLSYATPPLESGFFLAGTPEAGALFFQPWASDGVRCLRLDDVLGGRAALISAGAARVPDGSDDLAVLPLSGDTLAPFREPLGAWLREREATAVLVRPDRYVFGVGDPCGLVNAYRHTVRVGRVSGHEAAIETVMSKGGAS